MPRDSLILGIDGGGTSTLCVAANLSGEVLGIGVGGPSNHQVVPLEHTTEALLRSIGDSLQGYDPNQVVSICGGMAGIDWPGSEKPIVELFRSLFPKAVVTAVPDVVIAFHSVIKKLPGIIVISGTGAMGYGEDISGKEYRSSGWGYLLGDEGSGYDIGQKGLKAATQAFDGRGPETRLADYACDCYDISDLRDLLDIVYSQGTWSPNRTGEFGPYVVKAAYEGDAVSSDILNGAGKDLAKTALSILHQMDALEEAITIGQIGGVFANAGPLLHDAFRAELATEAPRAQIISGESHPVLGALIMAYRDCGKSELLAFRQSMSDGLHDRL
ncbi:MAG: hypothetical protein GX986_04870 [Firmicutes bacterium]|nr:hypothetical protein [Bacillota bacterium]